MKRFQDKRQLRLPSHDYSSPGAYFVTVQTLFRSKDFGRINHSQMCFSEIGRTADKYFKKIPEHFSNVSVDCYIVMPEHIHGIILIYEQIYDNESSFPKSGCAPWRVPTAEVERTRTGIAPLQRNSLSSVMNHYKGAVTRWARKNGYGQFRWQTSYYDRIIRSERELWNVRRYIESNPANYSSLKVRS